MFQRFLLVCLALAATPAQAELRFCNGMDREALVAIGYNDAGDWTSEGWWRIDPGECKNAVGGDLTKSYYYYRVEAKGITFQDENYLFCTSIEAFTIVGDEDCEARGYVQDQFNEIELAGRTSFTVDISAVTTDAPENSSQKAPAETGGAALLKDIMQPSASVDMPAAGTYGEPFTLTATFSHCDVLDAGIQCTFVEGDYFYVATTYNHTPEAILTDLYERPENSRLLISGDIASSNGNEAQIVLYSFMNAGSDDFSNTRDAMQGLWTSDDDVAFQVFVYGSLYEELYDGIPNSKSLMSFRDHCDGAPGDGPSFRLISSDSLEDRCFFVSHVDNTSMELFMAGGMRPLFFKKEN